MKIPTPIKQIVSKDHSRYAINGVLCIDDGTTAKAVATNGHMLVVVDCETSGEEQPERIVEVDGFPASAGCEVRIMDGDEAGVIDSKNRTVLASYVEGKFPSYQDVIPSTSGYQEIGLNAKYILAVAKAICKDKHKLYVKMQFRDKMHPIVLTGDAGIGVVMPRKLEY